MSDSTHKFFTSSDIVVAYYELRWWIMLCMLLNLLTILAYTNFVVFVSIYYVVCCTRGVDLANEKFSKQQLREFRLVKIF